MTRIEKIIISLLLSSVFFLNISAPLIYAFANDKLMQGCSLFCNLSDGNSKNGKQTPCPHHSQEAKNKKINELFQCRISQSPCHTTHTTTQAAPEVDPYILAAYHFNNNTKLSLFIEKDLIIPSQLYYISIEKPPTVLSYLS